MMIRTDLLIEHATELCTLAGPPGPRRGAAQSELGIIQDGAVAVGVDGDGLIAAVGTTDEVRSAVEVTPETKVIDASGRAVLPGFVDPHTHPIFGGDRVDEFALRLKGADYLEILAGGGGILSTVQATRAAPDWQTRDRLARIWIEMSRHGTTTTECKTGYGLSTAEELRSLQHPAWATGYGLVDCMWDISTLLAAHAVPPEYRHDPDEYVRVICEETIPTLSQYGLARFCDVFCERGVFTVDQCRRVLNAGRAHGLEPKVHAEQKSHSGGAALAAELRAASADHLDYATDDDLRLLAAAGTVAVFLPGAALMLREERVAPAQRAIELGVPVALATDFNPGTCPILSLQVIIGLACLQLGLSPEEALVASTINAAYAIGEGNEAGSLEPGKRADIVMLDAPSYRYFPYCFGSNLVHTVIQYGRVLHQGGESASWVLL